jgi:hypothetical protein
MWFSPIGDFPKALFAAGVTHELVKWIRLHKRMAEAIVAIAPVSEGMRRRPGA